MNRNNSISQFDRFSSGERLFLELLHPDVPKHHVHVDEAEISYLKSMALKHNLLMLVYTQLRKHQKEFSNNIPLINFLKEVKPLFLNNAAISMRQESIEKEIISPLRGRDIDAVVIKGNTIAKEIYNEPSCRTSTDIDILVRSSDVFQVDSLLSEVGYIRDQERPLEYCFYRIHHAGYKHPRTQTYIEIHWNFGIPFFYNLSSEEIWAEMRNGNSGKNRMPPELMLIQLFINHHMNAFRILKRIVDILWTLHRYEDVIEWSCFVENLSKVGLIKTASITLHQIQSLWREQATDMRSFKALNQEIAQRGFKRPRRLISYFKVTLSENYASRIFKDKLVARFALDKEWPAIILSYLKTSFPNPQAIKGYYKDQRTWTLPLNYCRFAGFLIKKWIKSDPRNW